MLTMCHFPLSAVCFLCLSTEAEAHQDPSCFHSHLFHIVCFASLRADLVKGFEINCIHWFVYTWDSPPNAHFVDILTHFGAVSKAFPKGLKAWDPCGVVFDGCSFSRSVWCVHRCSGDWVRYPCWSWSSELPACVLRSHSSFAVASPSHFFLLIITWGVYVGIVALG